MASPVISSVKTDKVSYNTGDVITVTVTYSDPDARSVSGTSKAVDSTGAAVNVAFTFAITDPVTVTVADGEGRVYSKVSDSGSVAVFTAKA